ncbi:hypothetical protein HY249_01245 [Candidatus Azambacteria bacterium]|nr:hypothetical protein [Candidatus Azambacteria bacterium]
MYNFDFEENTKWQRALDLTHAVWKVLDLSVESDLLRDKIKDLSSEILTKYTAYLSEDESNGSEIVLSIDSLIALLSLAQKTSHIREINFLILKNEYKKIRFYIASKLESKSLDQANERSISKKMEGESRPAEKKNENANARSAKKEEKKEIEFEEDVKELTDRQEVIMKFFNSNQSKRLRLKEAKKFFPSYTDRTIRNDLKSLCEIGVIARSQGRGQGSFYYLERK